MFWNCGSYKTSRLRLLGKVKRNWMPVLVSPSCKALTNDTGRWVSSEAGHLGKETRPVLPQMVPIYLTSGSRTNCRCLGPHLDFLIRLSREQARCLCFNLASQARFVIRCQITREEHRALGRCPPAWSQVPVRAGVSVLLKDGPFPGGGA